MGAGRAGFWGLFCLIPMIPIFGVFGCGWLIVNGLRMGICIPICPHKSTFDPALQPSPLGCLRQSFSLRSIGGGIGGGGTQRCKGFGSRGGGVDVPSFAKAMEASRDLVFLCTDVDFWGLLVGYQWVAHVDLNPHGST